MADEFRKSRRTVFTDTQTAALKKRRQEQRDWRQQENKRLRLDTEAINIYDPDLKDKNVDVLQNQANYSDKDFEKFLKVTRGKEYDFGQDLGVQETVNSTAYTAAAIGTGVGGTAAGLIGSVAAANFWNPLGWVLFATSVGLGVGALVGNLQTDLNYRKNLEKLSPEDYSKLRNQYILYKTSGFYNDGQFTDKLYERRKKLANDNFLYDSKRLQAEEADWIRNKGLLEENRKTVDEIFKELEQRKRDVETARSQSQTGATSRNLTTAHQDKYDTDLNQAREFEFQQVMGEQDAEDQKQTIDESRQSLSQSEQYRDDGK